MSRPFVIKHDNPRWQSVLETAVTEIRRIASEGDCMIRVGDVLRSLDQNAKQWSMLADIASQVPMEINGEKVMASKEDWKAVLTAGFTEEVRFAKSPFGGLVALGVSTKAMPKKVFSDYIEFLYSAGSEWGVAWSEKALEDYGQHRRT